MGFFPVNLMYLGICEWTENIHKGFSSCYSLYSCTGSNRVFCPNYSINSRGTRGTNIRLNLLLPAPTSFQKLTAWPPLPHFARAPSPPLLASASPQPVISHPCPLQHGCGAASAASGKATRTDRDKHRSDAPRRAAGPLRLPAPEDPAQKLSPWCSLYKGESFLTSSAVPRLNSTNWGVWCLCSPLSYSWRW